MNSKPVKSLQVIHALGMGGAETWLMEVLRLWRAQGASAPQMDIVATSGERGIFDDEAMALGAKIYYLPYGKKYLRSFVKGFRRLLDQGEYDAIHDHQDYTSGWHFLMAGGRSPAVRVAHVHNPRSHITVNYSVSPTRRMTASVGQFLVSRLATHVCGTSAAILREYGYDPGRTKRPSVSVVHCGIDVERFNQSRDPDRESVVKEFGWSEEVKIVLFAGRLDRRKEFHHPENHKNSWLALNVVRLAAEQDRRICLLMAGAGDEMRRNLEDTIAGWGLQGRLRLVGVRKDVDRLMRAADVLLFPSRQEGLGMVAVEAQAAGLAVVASEAVPRECMVLAEMCEFLPLDCPQQEWARKLLLTVEKPRISLAKCGDAVQASPFSIEFSAATLERIYRGKQPASVEPEPPVQS